MKIKEKMAVRVKGDTTNYMTVDVRRVWADVADIQTGEIKKVRIEDLTPLLVALDKDAKNRKKSWKKKQNERRFQTGLEQLQQKWKCA